MNHAPSEFRRDEIPSSLEPEQLSEELKSAGSDLGFNVVKIAPAVSPPGFHPLLEWLARGYAADMEWMPRRSEAYRHPDGVLPQTRSVIVAAMNYHNRPPVPGSARVARYAWGHEDYHTVLRRRLKQMAAVLQRQPEVRSRIVVDTAPLLERDFARLAGIGWFGKNTMLINRSIGSWFFLGAILTTVKLDYDEPFEGDFCGTCTSCLEACPTDAFPEARVLDSSRCISYLTIERRDKPIPESLRTGMADWVFGCDICQEVCPWNRFAPQESPAEFEPCDDLRELDVVSLLQLDEVKFRQRFANTPLERTGRDAIVRNAAIAAGNSKNTGLAPALQQLLHDKSEMVRDAAQWALRQLSGEHTRTSSKLGD